MDGSPRNRISGKIRFRKVISQNKRKIQIKGGRRTIFLIDYRGKPAVLKLGVNMNGGMKRERNAIIALQNTTRVVPEIIESSEHYIITPFYEQNMNYFSYKCLPLDFVHQLVHALVAFYHKGIYLPDLNLQNIRYSRKTGLKIIDLEYAYTYLEKPADFSHSFDIAGVPKDGIHETSPYEYDYNNYWRRMTGLDVQSVLTDPVWLQHLKRIPLYIRYPLWLLLFLRYRLKQNLKL